MQAVWERCLDAESRMDNLPLIGSAIVVRVGQLPKIGDTRVIKVTVAGDQSGAGAG